MRSKRFTRAAQVLVGIVTTAFVITPQAASAVPVGSVSAHVNWDWNGSTGGGTFWGSTAWGTQRHHDSWISTSCGGTMYWSVTDWGLYPYTTAMTGTADHAIIDMGSSTSRNAGLPYDPCTGFYHNWSLKGELVAIGLHRVVETTPDYVVFERDALATAVFCMHAWFGSGGACTGLSGSGTMRWRVPFRV